MAAVLKLQLLQAARQKLLQTLALRVDQHFTRVAALFNNPLVQEHQLVRHFTGKTHFVGHHHHRATFLGQVLHHLEHITHQFRVKC